MDAAKKSSWIRKAIITVVAIAILYGGYKAYKWYVNKKALENLDIGGNANKPNLNNSSAPGSSQKNTNTSSKPPAKGNDKFPLTVGSNGENVSYLQKALNMLKPANFALLNTGGNFDDATRIAVITWVGTNFYPVTIDNFNTILHKANTQGKGGAGSSDNPSSWLNK